ncbi:MAG: LLM class F420-dependent oxidoreductase [Solirubrobacterales bacterium]
MIEIKLGYLLVHLRSGPRGQQAIDEVRAAESAGYDSVWVNESYGSDAVSMLGWLTPQTSEIGLGAAIMPAPARPPTAAAMAGATLDALSGGRFIFGFGPTGPQVSEGWYGVPYQKPWGRVREYVEVVREVLRREGPLNHSGPNYTLPLAAGGSGASGQGKALKLNFHPVRNEIPVFLGAIGRKSVELCAEIADGWIPAYLDPASWESIWGEHLQAGFASSGRGPSDLEVSPTVQVAIGGDLETARTGARMRMTLYLGGMGSKRFNFYGELARRMGFGEVADRVQELFLEGRKEEAFNAVPDELLDRVCLLGDEDQVGEGLARYAAAGVDRLIAIPVHADPAERLGTIERLAALRG